MIKERGREDRPVRMLGILNIKFEETMIVVFHHCREIHHMDSIPCESKGSGEMIEIFAIRSKQTLIDDYEDVFFGVTAKVRFIVE